jgi:predicted branched-subunit amino acid permease
MAVFGVGFGIAAAHGGLSLAEATLMSALVFAGAAQFVIAEIWGGIGTAAGLATVALATLVVNMRLFLMSAELRPWLGGLPARRVYPGLALLTDPGWLLIVRYRAQGGADAAAFLASGITLWVTWIAATLPGHALGMAIVDPTRFGFDLIMPCFFAVLLVPLWRGFYAAIPWLVAGSIALMAARFLPAWWHIMAGAVFGSLTAGVLHARR